VKVFSFSRQRFANHGVFEYQLIDPVIDINMVRELHGWKRIEVVRRNNGFKEFQNELSKTFV
jgi:hypothetical protein